jgi:hypothetical protein
MTFIGYTTDLTDLIGDTLVEIEIKGNYKPFSSLYTPNDKSLYILEKLDFSDILNIYNVYGDKITVEFDKTIQKDSIIFIKDFKIGLEKLRQKLFFDKIIISNYDSDDDENEICHCIFTNSNYNIYKKKESNINFSGIQNIYDKHDNRLYATFYHVNGIKEGEYKIFPKWNTTYILNFVNDVQIGDLITIKNKN